MHVNEAVKVERAPTPRQRAFEFCSKPYKKVAIAPNQTPPKAGSAKPSSKNLAPAKKPSGKKAVAKGLVARVKPDDFEEVKMGEHKSCEPGTAGLWSDGFGTCPGFIVTGRPNSPDGVSCILMHFSLGESLNDKESKDKWADFEKAVRASGMTEIKGLIFTVNTDTRSREIKGDQFLVETAKALTTDYDTLKSRLKELIKPRSVVHQTHSFAQVGELQVDRNGNVRVDGRRVIL